MPLNALPQETLFSIITEAVDPILDSPIEYKIKMESLQSVVAEFLTVEQIVKENPGLVKDLEKQMDVLVDVQGKICSKSWSFWMLKISILSDKNFLLMNKKKKSLRGRSSKTLDLKRSEHV